MDVRGVDPRDEDWQIPHPAYRVYFHTSGSADEYELRDGELDEVRAWAEANAAGRWCGIWAVVPQHDSRVGLVRVAGDPPEEDPLRG